MEAWQWALIGVGIAAFIVINSGVIYCLHRHRNRSIDRYDQELSIETIVEEVITANPSVKTVDNQPDTDLLHQQQEYVTAVQTALSPPRPHVTKEKILTTSHKIIHEQDHDQEKQDQQKLRLFSLSPMHVASSSEKPSENPNSVCSTSTTDRSMTPFQGHMNTPPNINSIWRGPTPPWTQHSGRHSSGYSS